MKRNCLLLFLLIATCVLKAQDDAFAALQRLIMAKTPGISLSQKLIVFNVWSESDIASRETNKELDRTAAVFKQARLAGGKEGMIAVGIHNKNTTPAMIIFHADGIKELISLSDQDLHKLALPAKNGIYNNAGVLVGKDYTAGEIYEAVHKLITR